MQVDDRVRLKTAPDGVTGKVTAVDGDIISVNWYQPARTISFFGPFSWTIAARWSSGTHREETLEVDPRSITWVDAPAP